MLMKVKTRSPRTLASGADAKVGAAEVTGAGFAVVAGTEMSVVLLGAGTSFPLSSPTGLLATTETLVEVVVLVLEELVVGIWTNTAAGALVLDFEMVAVDSGFPFSST